MQTCLCVFPDLFVLFERGTTEEEIVFGLLIRKNETKFNVSRCLGVEYVEVCAYGVLFKCVNGGNFFY